MVNHIYLTVGEKAIWGASLSSSFVLLAAAPLPIDAPDPAFCCNSPPESRIRLRELHFFDLRIQDFQAKNSV